MTKFKNPQPLRGIVPAILIAIVAPGYLGAQTTTENIVQLTVSAQTVAPFAGAPVARHWVLVKPPSADDVQISNPDVRSLFVHALEDFEASQPANCNKAPPIVDNYFHGSCSGFIPAVRAMLSQESLTFVASQDLAPPSGTPPNPVVVMLRGRYSKIPDPPPMESLCIIAVLGVYTGSCDQNRDPATTKTVPLSSLAKEYKLGSLPDSQGNIDIQVRIAAPFSGLPPAQAFPRDAAWKQLQAAAVAVFLAARSANAVPPTTKPQANADELYRNILAQYTIEDSSWPVPDVFLSLAGSNRYQLMLRNLYLVEDSRVALNQGKDLSVDPSSAPKIDAMLADASCRIQKNLSSLISSLVGTIPTNDKVWAIARTVQKSDLVTGIITPAWTQRPAMKQYWDCAAMALEKPADNQNYSLDFVGAERWYIGSINGTTSAGIVADSHQLLQGDAELTETHVLSHYETTSLSVHGGPEVQTADLSFTLQNTTGPVTYGFLLDNFFRRDQNQRFGYLAGPKFVQEEFGPEPKVFVEFSLPQDVHAFFTDLRADLPWQFHHELIELPAGYPPFPNRGWVNGFAPSVSLLAGYDFAFSAANKPPKGGIGKVILNLGSDVLQARKGLGSDFAFNRYSLHGEAEVFFGVTTANDFVVRYNRGVAMSSGATPLFELPELGGDANIRGIEIGEYVGRGVGFDQTEFGINAQSAWHWFHKRDASAAKAAAKSASANANAAAGQAAMPSSPSLSSLGIDSIFITGLYDRARALPETTLASLFDLRHAFHGEGIKGELRGLRAANRRINLGLVYAYSPDSVLHHKGTFSTSVSMDF